MDFYELINDLGSPAIESAGEEYSSVAKSAKSAIRTATKAMKSGNYDEAIKCCNSAIYTINSFKASLSNDRGNDTDNQSAGNKLKMVKAIVISVLSGLAAASAVLVGKKIAKNKKTDVTKGQYALAGNRPVAALPAGESIGTKKDAKLAAAVGAAAVVGSGVIQVLSAFIKGKKNTPEGMVNALNASVKSLEQIKAACNEAKRGRANENYEIDPVLIALFDGVAEALFFNNDSYLKSLTDSGMDDLTACETYVDFIAPIYEC